MLGNIPQKVVIIGGGFGGLFTALEIADAAQVTLISEEEFFTFRPLLYEYLSGEVEAWHIAPYYRDLLDGKVRFIAGQVAGVDFVQQTVKLANQSLDYDLLVLATGSVTNYWGIDGAQNYALPFRRIRHADALRRQMTATLDAVAPNAAPQDARQAATFVVVGAGASGVELATKMSDLLADGFRRRGLRGAPRVVVVEMSDEVVPGMGAELRSHVTDALRKAQIELHLQTRVVKVEADGVTVEHNGRQEKIAASATIWTAGVKVAPMVEQLALTKNRRGLPEVRETLQSVDYENVFVLGDAAAPSVPPKLSGTAQLAFQQADLLAKNIKAAIANAPLQSREYEEMGEAVSLGTENAAVMVGEHAFAGAVARQARFALYTSRLPTWQHRLKVGASWFFGGTLPRPLQPLGLHKEPTLGDEAISMGG